MAASLSLSTSAGTITVTGSGFSGALTVVSLVLSFVATNAKRSSAELASAPAAGGAISAYAIPFAFTAGTVTVKAVDSTGATLATATVAV